MGFDLINSGKSVLESVTGASVSNVDGDSLVGSLGNTASGLVRPTGEPQRAYMWEVAIIDANASMVRYYAQTTTLPIFSQTKLRRAYAGNHYNYPGKDTTSGIFRVTFWDSQDFVAYRYFMNWHRIMNDDLARRRVRPDEYKKSIEMRFKDTSDTLNSQQFSYEGCFPTEVSGTQLSYESSDLFTFDVEFSFDRARMGNEKNLSSLLRGITQ